MMKRQCTVCKKFKDEETAFYKRSNGKFRTECKECHNQPLTEKQKLAKQAYDKSYYEQNKEQLSLKRAKYRQEHKDEVLAQEREYNKQNKDKILARKKEYNKKYYEKHKEEILNKRKQDYNNTKYGLDRKLLNTFSKFFNNPNKNIERDLDSYGLDYKFKDLKRHFDTLLKAKNLNYDSYGKLWELDHIIPRSNFNYQSSNDLSYKVCWSLQNLRPMLIKENRSRPKDGSDVLECLKYKILRVLNDKG